MWVWLWAMRTRSCGRRWRDDFAETGKKFRFGKKTAVGASEADAAAAVVVVVDEKVAVVAGTTVVSVVVDWVVKKAAVERQWKD